jgi:hypothetical protein
MGAHVPAPQTIPDPQALPQAPQLAESSVVSTQVAPHRVRPGRQAQAPPTQICVALQAAAQPPQFFGLFCVVTQSPPQVWPPRHWHPPAAQVAPCAQPMLHLPQ